MDSFPPSKQRPTLLEFVAALGCRDAVLRRDECGDWRINGDAGHVYAIPGGYQIIFLGSPRAWSFAKAASISRP